MLPGETITIADGRIIARDKRAALPAEGPENISEEAALTRLDAALMESVDLHQRSDVPYGMFLSGGTDSAAVLAAMVRINTAPVLAFTAGFDVAGAADEREAAARAAANSSPELNGSSPHTHRTSERTARGRLSLKHRTP